MTTVATITANMNTASNNAKDKALRKFNAAQLLQGDRAVLIELDGSEYRLQLTRSHKLILTK